MAKKSSIEKNKRRGKLVKQYRRQARAPSRRRQRRATSAGRALRGAPEAGGAAAQLLADPHPQPLRGHGPPARLLPQAQDVPDRAARARLAGRDPGPRQVELVRRATDGYERSHRRYARPASATRRCAARPRFDARLAAARARARRAAVRRLHPRLQTTEYGNGRSEFEIELKYFDGEPVIGEIEPRLQARPPRLFVGRRPDAGQERPRHLDPVDAPRASWRTRGPRRRTSAAKCSAGSSERRRTQTESQCLVSERSRSRCPPVSPPPSTARPSR